jgi:hypothetical protein
VQTQPIQFGAGDDKEKRLASVVKTGQGKCEVWFDLKAADLRPAEEAGAPRLATGTVVVEVGGRAVPPGDAGPRNINQNLDAKPKWSASGRVTDAEGKPMSDVEVWVHAGMGSLFRTGLAKTGADGRYTVEFGPGGWSSGDSPNLQYAQITAHKPGFYEENLNRHGSGAMALRQVAEQDLKGFGIGADALALPGKERTVDFVMLRAATVKGRLVGTGMFSNLSPEEIRKNPKTIAGYTKLGRSPLKGWQVWLKGKHMPPGASVICTVKTDEHGNFTMTEVPIGYDWQFLTETTRQDARDPLSPSFRLTTAEASFELELPEEQNALRFLETKERAL